MNARYVIVVGYRDTTIQKLIATLEHQISLLGWRPQVTHAASASVVPEIFPDGDCVVYLVSHVLGSTDLNLLRVAPVKADCLIIGIYDCTGAADTAGRTSAHAAESQVTKDATSCDSECQKAVPSWTDSCDLVIDVSFDKLYDVSIDVFASVKVWLTHNLSIESLWHNSLPRRAKTGGKKVVGILNESRLVSSLDQAASYARECRTLIVQGGNRYITSYLVSLGLDCRDIKLTCLTKSQLPVLVYSMLEPSDRALVLRPDQRDDLLSWNRLRRHTAWSRNPAELTVGEAALMLSDHAVPVPFSYPADDRRIKTEFRDAIDILNCDDAPILHALEEAGLVFSSILRFTHFWAWLQRTDADLLFIDDTFYRGRTFYVAGILARLLLRKERWKFLTLTADRVGRSVVHPRLTIVNRQCLYPYENSIVTERGYWDLCGRQYTWRDLAKYTDFLYKHATGLWTDPYVVRSTWQRMMAVTLAPLRINSSSADMVYALFELAIACTVRQCEVDVASLQDQRAWGMGYSAAFANVISHWIAQEEPRWKRQRYNDWAANVLRRIDDLIQRLPISDGLLTYYRDNVMALEYTLLLRLGFYPVSCAGVWRPVYSPQELRHGAVDVGRSNR